MTPSLSNQNFHLNINEEANFKRVIAKWARFKKEPVYFSGLELEIRFLVLTLILIKKFTYQKSISQKIKYILYSEYYLRKIY